MLFYCSFITLTHHRFKVTVPLSLQWVLLLHSLPSGYLQVSLSRSEPVEVHYRWLEPSCTIERPKKIQPAAPWTTAPGPPVRPNTKSRHCFTIMSHEWIKKLSGEIQVIAKVPLEVPTLIEPMICGDGWGMRAMVVRNETACSSSSSLFLIRSVSRIMQFSDPHAGNASNSGCLSKQLPINIKLSRTCNLCYNMKWRYGGKQ